MNFSLKTGSRVAIFLILAILSILGLRIDWSQSISADVFDLLGSQQSNNREVQKIQSLLQNQLSREVIFVIATTEKTPSPAVKSEFIQRIIECPSFESVSCLNTPPAAKELIAFLYQHRHFILFPKWLERTRQSLNSSVNTELQSVCDIATRNLDQFLLTPESMAYEDHLTEDPLLLIPDLLNQLGKNVTDSSGSSLLFSAKLVSPPSTPGTQVILEQDLLELRSWLSMYYPAHELIDTGFHRYASESKDLIKGEIFRLNLISLFVTLAIAITLLRKPILLLPLIFVLVLSIAGALVTSILYFGKIHVIALVIGSILTGVAVDYCFHLLLKREELKQESFWETLCMIRVPLITSCFSTVFGFLVLLTNPVAAIQQLGLFVSVGLLFSLLFSVLIALAFDRPGPWKLSRNLNYSFPLRRSKSLTFGLLFIPLCGIIIFCFFSSQRDDIQDLQVPLVDAPANEVRIRSHFQKKGTQSYWISMGDSFLELIDHQQKLTQQISEEGVGGILNLALILPGSNEITRFLEFRNTYGNDFIASFAQSLERNGFDPLAFDAFQSDFQTFLDAPYTMEDWEDLGNQIFPFFNHQLSFLLSRDNAGYWGASRVQGVEKAISWSTDHTFELAPLRALNHAFASYRGNVTRSLWYSLGVIMMGLVLVFKPRKAGAILLLPAFAVLTSLGLLTLFKDSFSLFNLIGLLLGTCITLDYSVFISQKESAIYPISIRASAFTTLASFAVLSSSKIPAVSDLGITVFVITFVGLFFAEYLNQENA